MLGCFVDKEGMLVEHCGRPIAVRALPIGIPYGKFEQLAKEAPRMLPTDTMVSK